MQTKEAINIIPIQKFIQQVKVADAGNHKEIKSWREEQMLKRTIERRKDILFPRDSPSKTDENS